MTRAHIILLGGFILFMVGAFLPIPEMAYVGAVTYLYGAYSNLQDINRKENKDG